MNWNKWIRQMHRWLSIAFAAAIIVNFIALGGEGEPAFWVYLVALVPLFLLLFTGLYLFALPYLTRWQNRKDSIRAV